MHLGTSQSFDNTIKYAPVGLTAITLSWRCLQGLAWRGYVTTYATRIGGNY